MNCRWLKIILFFISFLASITFAPLYPLNKLSPLSSFHQKFPPFGKLLSREEKIILIEALNKAHATYNKKYKNLRTNIKTAVRYRAILEKLIEQEIYFRVFFNSGQDFELYWFVESDKNIFTILVSDKELREVDWKAEKLLTEKDVETYELLEEFYEEQLLQIYQNFQKNPCIYLNRLIRWLTEEKITSQEDACLYQAINCSQNPDNCKKHFNDFVAKGVPKKIALRLARADNPLVSYNIYTQLQDYQSNVEEVEIHPLAIQPPVEKRFLYFKALIEKNNFSYEDAFYHALTIKAQYIDSELQDLFPASKNQNHKKNLKETNRKDAPILEKAGPIKIQDHSILVLRNSHVEEKKMLRESHREIINELKFFLQDPHSQSYEQNIPGIKRIRLKNERLYLRYFSKEKVILVVGFSKTGDVKKRENMDPQYKHYLKEAGRKKSWSDFNSVEILSRSKSGQLELTHVRKLHHAIIQDITQASL